jgi:hypothetical protein
MVEHATVNRRVEGSSPSSGAIFIQPSEKSTKYFAAVEVFQCAADTKWLGKATKVVSENWKR